MPTLLMLGVTVVIALFSLWLINRELIEHIAQLSQGNFGQHIDATRQDELGKLAVAEEISRHRHRHRHCQPGERTAHRKRRTKPAYSVRATQ